MSNVETPLRRRKVPQPFGENVNIPVLTQDTSKPTPLTTFGEKLHIPMPPTKKKILIAGITFSPDPDNPGRGMAMTGKNHLQVVQLSNHPMNFYTTQNPQATIVIFTNPTDAHLPFVLQHLKETEVIIIDPLLVIKGNSLDYYYHNHKMEVFYLGEKLENVKSIWFRRPSRLEKRVLHVKKEYKEFVFSGLSKHLNMLTYLFADAHWISNPGLIDRADMKAVQLTAADKVGFCIPKTLFATNAEHAKTFVQSLGKCVIKPQSALRPKNMLAFTKIITKEDELDYAGLSIDPHIFQEYIEPYREFRVSVVGEKVFAASVSGDDIDGEQSYFRDWRYAHVNDSFKAEAVGLRSEDANRCVALVKELGLAFGAIDLIEDKKGDIWFLEINPNGQWAFIEEATGQPIGKTIAAMLTRA